MADPQRVALKGPLLLLLPNAAQYLGIALHELAANAQRSRALKQPGGHVTVEWSPHNAMHGIETLSFAWTEHGGPSPGLPTRDSFGKVVLEKATPAALRGLGRIEPRPAEMAWRLKAPAANVCA